MKRRLLTLAAGVSTLLCVATLVLWERGYRHRDVFTLRVGSSSAIWLESVRGGIQLVRQTNAPEQIETGWDVAEAADPLPSNTRFGFGAVATTAPGWDGQQSRTIHIAAVTAPSYAIALAFLILPAVCFISSWRRRRGQGNRCPHCGYDLRATPARCPECGTERALATDGAPIHTDV